MDGGWMVGWNTSKSTMDNTVDQHSEFPASKTKPEKKRNLTTQNKDNTYGQYVAIYMAIYVAICLATHSIRLSGA